MRTCLQTLAVALCLALMGCGGSSGGVPSVTQDVHDELQGELAAALALLSDTASERDAASERLAALEAELAAARAEAAALAARIGSADDPASLEGMLAAAEAEVARLTGELDAANALAATLDGLLTVAKAEADSLRRLLDDARDDVTEAEARADQAEADAQAQIDEAETQADVDARAPRWIEALDLETGDVESGVVVEHMRGQSRKVEPTGNYARDAGPPSVTGFAGAGFTRERGAVGTETLRLYTNLGPPGTRQWWKVHGAMDIDIGTTNDDARPSGFGNDRSLYQDSGGTPENRDDVTRSGTYQGVSGTFSCATGCNMAADADGTIMYTGTWTFKPGSLASGIPQPQDTEFLYFGDWAFRPDDAADAHAYRWIAGGQGAISTANFGALDGTATFSGGAIGRYALRNQVGQEDRIGSFTATATFTADFDTDMIDGRLTDFRNGGTALTGWSAYLGGSASGPVALEASGIGTGVTTASIGGVSATGAWDATLHGTNNPGYDQFGDTGEPDCPVSACPAADLAGIVGWFDAGSDGTFADSDAAIAGAFGAER